MTPVLYRDLDCLKSMSEAQFRRNVEGRLEEHFHLSSEVTGYDEFHECQHRIDLMIEPRFDWHIPCFGVEFKRPDQLKTVGYGHWIRQAFNYHRTDWGRFGKSVPVLICPSLTWYEHLKDRFVMHDLQRVMGAFNIGELVPTPGRLEIRMCDSRLWIEHSGLNAYGRSWKLARTGH